MKLRKSRGIDCFGAVRSLTIDRYEDGDAEMEKVVEPIEGGIALVIARWALLILGGSQLVTLAEINAADVVHAWGANSFGVAATIGLKATLAFILIGSAAATVKRVWPSVSFAAVATLMALGWIWMPAENLSLGLAVACALVVGWRKLPGRKQATRRVVSQDMAAPREAPLARSPASAALAHGSGRQLRSALVVAVVVGVVAAAWLTRYEWTPAGHGAAFRTNRWTGETVLIAGQRELPVQREKSGDARSAFQREAALGQGETKGRRAMTAEEFLDTPNARGQ